MSRLTVAAYNHLQNYKIRYDLVLKYASGKEGPEKELALEYKRLADKYSNLVNEHITLMAEAHKLEAENNFMLRLINERDKDESN